MHYFFFLTTFLFTLCVANVHRNLPSSQVSSIIETEFIVSFTNFYSEETRSSILNEAMTGVSDNITWREIPRNNPGQSFPSDFSVVELSNGKMREKSETFLAKLNSHNRIRSVSPQKRFTRKNLNFAHSSVQKDPKLLCIEGHEDFIQNFTGPESAAQRRQLGYPTGRSSSDRREAQKFALGRRLMRVIPTQLTSAVNADVLWSRGITGKGVKVAIFDTGLGGKHPHFRNVAERTDWTDEGRPSDALGHGTFVAGVIASQSPDCLGIAPDADLYLFRVFTDLQVSYTSWFLDAFNYAIHSGINILNLSIGGPDFLDQPFVDKVWELTSNNIILVSAIGNDGPLYGTLNNPADQMDVIGVGGIDFEDRISTFSSRGMTTWELPGGYGRLKPDLVAYGSNVRGSGLYGNCRTLSGTSVSSPVVTGAVALLTSAVEPHRVNPASVKQALIESAKKIPAANMFEQGHGKLDLLHAYQLLSSYKPHASLSPAYLDTTECPYMWPYCSQPLFHTSMPLTVNVTVLNGMGVVGSFVKRPVWQPVSSDNSDKIEVSISYSQRIWPWSGWMAVIIKVSKPVSEEVFVKGQISALITSPVDTQNTDYNTEHTMDSLTSTVTFPINIRVVPAPPREQRVLWDQFHSLRYPGGYFPRDNLYPMLQAHQKGPHSAGAGAERHEQHGAPSQQQPLDWHADHVHTNFRELWLHLRALEYYVDVLGEPYTCFEASNYGTLMIVDPEEEFFREEIDKLYTDVTGKGLNIIVLADWYNVEVMNTIKFFDENTQQWWTPVTGGSNIPALNDLLTQFGIAFSDGIYAGTYSLSDVTINEDTKPRDFPYLSGSALARYPSHARVLSVALHDQVAEVTAGTVKEVDSIPILAVMEGSTDTESGRIVAFGDSSCFDSTDFHPECMWLIKRMLDYTRGDNVTDLVPPHQQGQQLSSPLPVRSPDSDLHLFSKILDPTNPGLKRSVVSCSQIIWNRPRPMQASGLDAFQLPGRTLRDYVEDKDEKLTFGIVISADVDREYNLPYIFPICIVILFAIFYWLCFRNSFRRTKYKFTSLDSTGLPIV